MTVVHVPGDGHRCLDLNDYGYSHPLAMSRPGTVVECACGRTYVAERHVVRAGQQYSGVIWRREGRIERWWRER